MGSDEADEDVADGELHDNHKPVSITADVEDVMLIPDIVSRGEINLDVRKVSPLCLLCDVIPSFEGHASIFVPALFVELSQFSV